MKKAFVLVVLFIFPLVAYLFFASGVNNFGKLPVLTENIPNVSQIDNAVNLNDKITILGFMGGEIEQKKGNAFNLNQKIYKRFKDFKDFQIVMVVLDGTEDKVKSLKDELGTLSNVEKWNFAYGNEAEVKTFFHGLKTNLSLDENLSTPYVFIVDKNRNLRGRNDDEDEEIKYGFNTTSVAELNNKMEDDVKIILAEYRLALKKNNANRSK
ncbi:hypothetical protein DKG77_00120 [Flagellimonas aquimarina]|uniref:Alkyl hydroperoxide reductase subunit C/ Thiol specific antioxidant domain-containing protein n=1 Tax=Flagellimonas aquimarina TaxID=2201895 RepID=A0A316L4T9_9FLAO|nr:hypothetical protein [Allomuricauda koreensis]PWL39283.1 hypothetical protein DKG77_00120 [Allomuricauda koreensis]